LQPFIIWSGRKTRRGVAPFPTLSRGEVAIEISNIAARNGDPNIFVVSNPTIPFANSNNFLNIFVEDLHANQVAKNSFNIDEKISNSMSGPNVLETTFFYSPGTEDKNETGDPTGNLCLAGPSETYIKNHDKSHDTPFFCFSTYKRDSNRGFMDNKKETIDFICNGNNCSLHNSHGTLGANRNDALESDKSLSVSCEILNVKTNGVGSSENQQYIHTTENIPMPADNCCDTSTVFAEPLNEDDIDHSLTASLQKDQSDKNSLINNCDRNTGAVDIARKASDFSSIAIHSFRLGDDMTETKKSRFVRESNCYSKEVQVIHQADNIITISNPTCSLTADWSSNESEFPHITVDGCFIGEDQNSENASIIAMYKNSAELNKSKCDHALDFEDRLTDSSKACCYDDIGKNEDHTPNKKADILSTKLASIVPPHFSKLTSITQLSQARGGHRVQKASTAWIDNVKDGKINPSSVSTLAAHKPSWQQRLKSSFSYESEVSPVIEMEMNMYLADDVDEFSQSYRRIQKKWEVDSDLANVNLPGEICTSPQL
jgi:hypothetical protein